ncbi:hypothetical protein DM01DRAFT_1337757 [Hesseltinella vesiculosa]|uniref:THUMP domain-containing protein n=1 Tax=Hesseltinella vesiculosa TaxID=101127 RepID=A0A1X2GCI8_9FUNG|nr:hypothetical protein DM01DRAFT_1337757 [Hesseltinella vesiculosa]
MKRNAGPNRSQRQKRTKVYHCAKDRVGSKSQFNIQPGMQGVIVMCTRGREQRAMREAMDLFIKYANDLYPATNQLVANEVSDGEDDDLEASIAKELAELKETKHEDKRFVNISTATDCVLFIKTHPDIPPVALVHAIMKDVKETQLKQTRYISRLLPVETICAMDLEKIQAAAKPILTPHFHSDDPVVPKTFCVAYRSRNCGSADRSKITETLAASVGRPHVVDLKEAQLTIIAEVLQSICMMSVVPDFNELRKYNLESILGLNAANKKDQAKSTEVSNNDDKPDQKDQSEPRTEENSEE